MSYHASEDVESRGGTDRKNSLRWKYIIIEMPKLALHHISYLEQYESSSTQRHPAWINHLFATTQIRETSCGDK
jgi:hypothetical protein